MFQKIRPNIYNLNLVLCFLIFPGTAHLDSNRRRRISKDGTELCRLVKNQNRKGVKKYSERNNFDPNLRHELGFSALHVAVVEKNLNMIKLLLDLGADVNLQDFTAPAFGQRAQIRMQDFSSNIRPDAATQGFTALHYAIIFKDQALIKLLLSRGADPHKLDSNKRCSLDWIDTRTSEGKMLKNSLEEEYEKYLDINEEREKEYRRLFPLEEQFKETIVGQLSPIHSVASAIRRKQNGWHDEDHPLVFLFLGSSGVGKTELAKTIARCLNKDDPKSFIRIDMSEFQHKHEVAKFIGSPPGYVGYEEGGQLTKRLKERPNSVILLDEVEKAHSDVLTIMLQLFDEGRITDGKGETIECKNALFVMTSNLAQTEIGNEAEALRREAKETEITKDLNDEITSLSRNFIEVTIQPILKKHFKRDEFLGRINEVLYFLPFNDSELRELTQRELKKWEKRAKERHDIRIYWSDRAIEEIQSGYNFRYGARSIQHEVEKRVVNQMAKAHELGKIGSNSKVYVKCSEDGEIQIDSERETEAGWFFFEQNQRV